MTSPSPLLYDTYYHIYNRGNNGENIFIQERNYTYFMKLYTKYIDPIAETFAYCLLRNHFHILLKTKTEEEIKETLRVSSLPQKRGGQAALPNQYNDRAGKPLGSDDSSIETLRVSSLPQNRDGQATPPNQNIDRAGKPLGSDYLSNQFSAFFNAYAKAINHAYGRTGSLFEHPFGRVIITSDRQFWNVIAYIHQNPQKHKFVKDFRHWKWSSYGTLLAEKPTKLKRDLVLDWFGGRESYQELHQKWVSDADATWFVEDDYD